MLKKYKYLVAGVALILFALPMTIQAIRLDAPAEDRDCVKWGTSSGLYMCFVSMDGTYAKWFTGYQPMHDYYTPQLKETYWGVGNQAASQRKTFTGKIGAYTVSNLAIEYTYTKGR